MSTATPTSIVTPSQTVGPFFHYALPYAAGHALVPDGYPGAFRLFGRVVDGGGVPVPDALVEIWQADPDGRFRREPGLFASGDGFCGFGRSGTDAEGRYWFRTVKPGAVTTVDGRAQAPHIAMSIFARGLLRRLVTRVYFPDESAANATDPLLSTVTPARRDTLLARQSADGLEFDVRLQGEAETVFLDV